MPSLEKPPHTPLPTTTVKWRFPSVHPEGHKYAAIALGITLLGTTLRYPYELRNAEDYFSDITDVKVPKDMLQLAEHILDSKAADFEPAKFVDRYEEAVVEMLKQKQAGQPVAVAKPAAPASNVVNLMDALRRSISDDKQAPAGKARKVSPAKQEEQRKSPQFKFPIKGGKSKEAAKQAAAAPKAQAKAAPAKAGKRKKVA